VSDDVARNPNEPGGPARPGTFSLKKLALIFFGYGVAVAAATLVAVILMLAPTALPDDGARESPFRTMAELAPAMLVIGFFWTFLCALPGFIVAIVVGERSRWRGWKVYSVAGFFNVMPSLALFGGFAGSPLEMPGMVAAAFPGGLAGGAAYWAGAGRFVAAHRRLA
jgi:hypothetical protein